jgi:hypothetical protein
MIELDPQIDMGAVIMGKIARTMFCVGVKLPSSSVIVIIVEVAVYFVVRYL